MSNVSLIKDNTMPLVLPATAVTAIVALNPPYMESTARNPDAKSLIYSDFGGFKVHFLAQTAREVHAELASRTDTSKLFEVPAGVDSHFLRRDGFRSLEGDIDRGPDGTRDPLEVLVVHFTDSDDAPRTVRGAFTPETVQAIMADLESPVAKPKKA